MKKALKKQDLLQENLAERQVVSLDLATKLLNLGFRLPTFFCWIRTRSVEKWHIATIWCGVLEDEHEITDIPIPAPSATELGELLPDMIVAKYEDENRQWELFCGKDRDGWFCGYFNASYGASGKFIHIVYGDNEANARAEMLIVLKNLKLIP